MLMKIVHTMTLKVDLFIIKLTYHFIDLCVIMFEFMIRFVGRLCAVSLNWP